MDDNLPGQDDETQETVDVRTEITNKAREKRNADNV